VDDGEIQILAAPANEFFNKTFVAPETGDGVDDEF
jgi:hypothetical protein